MKRTAFWYSILGCLSIILLMTSCKKSSDYARVIPADAEVVCRIQTAQLLEKCGADNGKFLKEKLLSVINRQASSTVSEKMSAIADDPSKSGLDFKSPVYVAIGGEALGTGAMLVAKVADQDALTGLLETIAAEVAEKVSTDGDLTYLTAGGTMMVSDGKAFLMMEQAGSGMDALNKVKAMLSADEEKSILNDAGFKKMNDSKGDMQLLGNAEYMMDVFQKELKVMASMYPAGFNPNDISGLMDVNFADGEVAFTIETIAKTEEARKYLENINKFSGKVGDTYFSRIPDKSLVVMALNMEGEKFWEQLQSVDNMDALPAETKVLIEKGIKNLDGDVVMAVQADPIAVVTNQDEAVITIYAKLKDGSQAEQMLSDMGLDNLTRNSDGIYALPMQKGLMKYLYLKVDGKDMVISNKIDMVGSEKVSDPVDASTFKGKGFAFLLNLKPIMENPAVEAMAKAAGARPTLWSLVSQFDRVEIFSKEAAKAECHVYLKDNKQNALAFLVNIGLQLSDEMI